MFGIIRQLQRLCKSLDAAVFRRLETQLVDFLFQVGWRQISDSQVSGLERNFEYFCDVAPQIRHVVDFYFAAENGSVVGLEAFVRQKLKLSEVTCGFVEDVEENVEIILEEVFVQCASDLKLLVAIARCNIAFQFYSLQDAAVHVFVVACENVDEIIFAVIRNVKLEHWMN